MPWYWQFLVTVGAWAQTHQHLALALGLTMVVLCGAARLPWRTFFTGGRPRP